MFIHRQRMEIRTAIAMKGVMHVGGRDVDITLTNASARGMLVMLENAPPRGTPVDLTIGDSVFRGQVRWRTADRCGIALKQTIDLAELREGKAVPVVHVPERFARRGAMDLLRSFLG